MPLFTHYIAVDWSAHNTPKRGKDSIWVSEVNGSVANIRTRHATVESLKGRIKLALEQEQRLLIGFDFAFGYPAGLAKALTGQANWQTLWTYLVENITDDEKNKSNRFEVAGQMNKKIGLEEGPFWGHPHQHGYKNLGPSAPVSLPVSFPKKRLAEKQAVGAKSVYQLAYNGAVGSQTLLGIAALERLRRDPVVGPSIAIWPFETRLSGDVSKPITFAEIYPSSHDVDKSKHAVLDAAQVMSVARDLAYWDKTGALEDKLSAFGLTDMQRDIVMTEEGWILGC